MLSVEGDELMEPIYEGMIKNDSQTTHRFTVHVLTLVHLPEILFVQEQILMELKDKESLQPLSSDEFKYILSGEGLMLGAFVDDALIAFRALLVPPIDEEQHLGLDLGLKDQELKKVIYQEISNVVPEYRGNQLQKTLATLIMQELSKEEHPYRYICCTVAPFNIPSLKDKFAQGMAIIGLKEKYEGLLRYIFVKDLENVDTPLWQEVAIIEMNDITAQQSKLAEGWRGYHMEIRDDNLWIHYGRK